MGVIESGGRGRREPERTLVVRLRALAVVGGGAQLQNATLRECTTTHAHVCYLCLTQGGHHECHRQAELAEPDGVGAQQHGGLGCALRRPCL